MPLRRGSERPSARHERRDAFPACRHRRGLFCQIGLFLRQLVTSALPRSDPTTPASKKKKMRTPPSMDEITSNRQHRGASLQAVPLSVSLEVKEPRIIKFRAERREVDFGIRPRHPVRPSNAFPRKLPHQPLTAQVPPARNGSGLVSRTTRNTTRQRKRLDFHVTSQPASLLREYNTQYVIRIRL
ncbi:hypothetical protein F5144DRAFT_380012 [Chaetomium tenue]|uniref:Uncharacterized protein n=1 Tax=Chaetomium tenue TaxID=1854479 RepID=A0ACB7NUE8_9PEZI|nr:hypothetical protein F5144DRAFT_380012 [Chaetomium globosum]